MPQFQLVSQIEAEKKSVAGRRRRITHEYLEYILQVRSGQAGKLQPLPEETAAAVRRRLGAAARLSGRDLVIKRTGDEIYFWDKPGSPTRRRGRPRKIENMLR